MQSAQETGSLRPNAGVHQRFAALFVGAYALLLVDLYLRGWLWDRWAALAAGALVVLLGSLGFPAVERRRERWLNWAYFAVQLPLGAAVFGLGGIIGATFLLLIIVGQSVRVLPPWATFVIGAPLPLLHLGMDWPSFIREGGVFWLALVFLVMLSQAMVKAERSSEALDEANRALRSYAAQSEEFATARERNRIAREIHDGLGHYLTTIHMQLQAARSMLTSDPGRADQTLAKAQHLAQEALGDVRRSVAALRAEREPLPTALAKLAEASEAAGLPTTFSLIGVARALDPPEEQALYRAAQEGLTNARKHAQAASAALSIDFTDAGRVRLTVADDGRGATDPAGGYGLLGLRERVELLDGSLTVRSAPGAGLELVVEVNG